MFLTRTKEARQRTFTKNNKLAVHKEPGREQGSSSGKLSKWSIQKKLNRIEKKDNGQKTEATDSEHDH